MSTFIEIDVIDSYSVEPASAGATDVIIVAEPGAPGADGADLTPEERAELIEDIEDEVLDELEPPINLVLRYNNIRSQG